MEPRPTLRGMAPILAVVAAVIVLLILVAYVIKREKFSTRATTEVRSRVDGELYRVHDRHENAVGAADRIARVKTDWMELLRRLRQKYSGPAGAAYPERARAVERLLTRYDPTAYVENSPLSGDGETSYTTDKGRQVALCLREENPGKNGIHDFERADVLFYVHLHEMGHIAAEQYGHKTEFWQTFKFLLEEAVAAGMYRPRNFERRPARYCGMTIEYCPLFHSDMVSI